MTTSKVSNLLTTIGIVLLVGLVVEQRWTQYKNDQQRLELEQEETYQPGEVVNDTPELGLNSSHSTLLIGTASTCKYCTASMPFYSRLLKQAQENGVQVVAYTVEDITTNRAYLASHEVKLNTVVSGLTNHVLLSSTPTLVLVRRDGTVVKSWIGRLRPSQEQEVFQLLEEKRS